MDSFILLILIAAILAGGGTSLLGVYIIGLRMPFIGTCISHAAMAGTIASLLVGIDPIYGAVGFSIAAALGIAFIRPGFSLLDNNVATAIMFSFMLGLIFLCMGLLQDSRSEMLGLLWGSLLFIQKKTLIIIAVTSLVLVVFVIFFNKELKAILFSRVIAAATGVHERVVLCGFLVLCGFILSVNLQTVGGLMIFSLINNPAAAAYQLCRGFKSVVIMSVLFGILSAVIGFFVSWRFDLPVGACIVLTSTAIFAVSALIRRFAGISY